MQSARYLAPLTKLPDLEYLIEQQLVRDWVVRIEYTDAVDRYSTYWQQWGSAIMPNDDATHVIDAIMTCYAEYPTSSIRLHAEKTWPRSQLLYWVHRPDEREHGLVLPACSKPVLHRESVNSGKWISAMRHLVRRATSSFASLMTLLGLLIASLLIIEMAVAQ
jgi:ribulose bisphosphate carboxylase small subunit